jgi:thioredoxin 1
MLTRRHILTTAALLAASGFPMLHAAESTAFTSAKFEAAQKAGKSILVDIWASWCPTCKAQAPVIESLSKSDKFKDIVVLRVDFDAQADVVRALGAQQQSTLIAFKGSKEVGRSVGETDPVAIEALFAMTV